MATSIPYASTQPITIRQPHHKTSSSSSSSSYSSGHDIVDSSPDSSYEYLPLARSPKIKPQPDFEPVLQLKTSTLASTSSVDTYDSRNSKDSLYGLPSRRHQEQQFPGSKKHINGDDEESYFDDTERIQLLPSDAAIPSALPIYRLPSTTNYPVYSLDAEYFKDLFPSLDRFTVRHDNFTLDGNMNLRVETPPHFVRRPKRGDKQVRSSSRRETSERPFAFQLFHLRMHDLVKREFSLRRYSRDSGREVCSTKRAFVLEGQQLPVEEDEDEQPVRPSTKRSVSSAFQSITQTLQRASPNNPSHSRRPTSSCQSPQQSSRNSRSTFGCSQDAKSVISSDRLSPSASIASSSSHPSLTSPPPRNPLKIATDTIKLEFQNYARVDLTRIDESKDSAAVMYDFEWWGRQYSWKRHVDRQTDVVSYHLIRDKQEKAVAHIVPETRGIEEARADEDVGGWVPPCHIWISDKSVIDAKTDVADIVMATGLLTLVDDSIRTRWQLPKVVSRPPKPVKSYTSEVIAPRPKGLLNSIFNRRGSEQCTSRNTTRRRKSLLAQ